MSDINNLASSDATRAGFLPLLSQTQPTSSLALLTGPQTSNPQTLPAANSNSNPIDLFLPLDHLGRNPRAALDRVLRGENLPQRQTEDPTIQTQTEEPRSVRNGWFNSAFVGAGVAISPLREIAVGGSFGLQAIMHAPISHDPTAREIALFDEQRIEPDTRTRGVPGFTFGVKTSVGGIIPNQNLMAGLSLSVLGEIGFAKVDSVYYGNRWITNRFLFNAGFTLNGHPQNQGELGFPQPQASGLLLCGGYERQAISGANMLGFHFGFRVCVSERPIDMVMNLADRLIQNSVLLQVEMGLAAGRRH